LFMTRWTQPNDFKGFRVILVMRLWKANLVAMLTTIWARKCSGLQCPSNLVMRRNLFSILILPSLNHGNESSRMFLSPFASSFVRPFSNLFSVGSVVRVIPQTDCLFVFLSVLAVFLRVLRDVFKAIFVLVFRSCYRVFEWHGVGIVSRNQFGFNCNELTGVTLE